MDLKSFAETVIRRVAEFVQPALDELSARIDSIPAGKDGRDGIDGKDGAPGADGQKGDRGEPGERGEKGDVGPQGERGERGEKGDTGEPGEKGEKGDSGERGADGAKGEKGDKGDPGERGPQGEKGDAGTPGERGPAGEKGIQGERGEQGPAGRDGIDGKSVTLGDVKPVIEAAVSTAALETERRGMDLIQRCIDRIEKPKDGAPGRDGVDGMGFDDLTIEHDGERDFKFVMTRGERRKEFAFKVPALIERGVFRPEQAYERGDGVTFGGSYWIAQKDAPGKPGEGDGWRLAVKRGRDGKDGEKGERGERGPVGPKGNV